MYPELTNDLALVLYVKLFGCLFVTKRRTCSVIASHLTGVTCKMKMCGRVLAPFITNRACMLFAEAYGISEKRTSYKKSFIYA